MSTSIKESFVYTRLIEDDFIYKAIYALDSYLFEKDLLNQDDYLLMLKLKDPFNDELITETTTKVRNKLNEVLIDGEFFEAQVYFRPKKIDKVGNIESRPLHSASLVTLIASVVLLNVLLLDVGNQKDSIELSELARMLPPNFYGNIPSESPEYLFKPWYNQYKKYTDAITQSYYDYTKTKEYKFEVTLDLKNFFPSINPLFIFEEVMDNYSVKYSDNDRECLETILFKLLVFKITNLKNDFHKKLYYDNAENSFINGEYWSRGIAQGLPHSYFFGNICMVKVAEVFKSVIVGKEGKSFYYVDDSVIYTNELDDVEELQEKITEINKGLEKLSEKNIEEYRNKTKGTSLEPYISIFDEFNFLIEVHPADSEKSVATEIQNPKYGQANLNAYSKLASMATYDLNKIFSDIEEINLSGKLQIIYEAVEKEVERIRVTEAEPDIERSNYIKVLLRFKKFFKYRQKRLDYNKECEISDADVYELLEKFKVEEKTIKVDMKNFLKSYDEDIVLNEFRFFFANRADFWEKAEEYVNNFNKVIYKEDYKWVVEESEYTISYFHKICENLLKRKDILLNNNITKYDSTLMFIKENIGNISKTSKDKKEREIQKAISFFSECFIRKGYITEKTENEVLRKILCKTKLVDSKSRYKLIVLQTQELYRIIMNTYFSELISVETNDLKYLAKRNNKPIYYNEARVVLFLRNRRFKIEEFSLQFNNYKNSEGLDYTLFEVIDYFEKFVQEPVYIDNLIMIHKYTSDIWKNGSKYLHFYTLHNQEHAIELIKSIIQFMKSVNYFQIDKRDYYTLFISCYLHDISMVLHPDLVECYVKDNKSSNLIFSEFKNDIQTIVNFKNSVVSVVEEETVKKLLVNYFRKLDQYYEEYVRSNHSKQSARFIRKSNDFNFIDEVVKDIVAEVSQAHCYNVDEIYKIKSNAQESIVSEKYLKILLRIGDLLDMSSSRISNAILDNNQKSMSDETRFHWLSHKAISNIVVSVNYELNEIKSNQSFIGPKAIIENVEFVVCLDVKHIIGANRNKKCNLAYKLNKDGKCNEVTSFNITIGNTATCDACSFMCKWMKIKNKYLYDELEALQEYLDRSESNLFKTNIKVKYIFNKGARRLKNSEYDSILEYISKVDI